MAGGTDESEEVDIVGLDWQPRESIACSLKLAVDHETVPDPEPARKPRPASSARVPRSNAHGANAVSARHHLTSLIQAYRMLRRCDRYDNDETVMLVSLNVEDFRYTRCI